MSRESRWPIFPMSLGTGAVLLLLLPLVLLSGCSTTGDRSSAFEDLPDPSSIPDAVPKAEPKSKYGNPKSYVVFGKRYRTKASSKGHVERGLASWYGKKFHGRKTSSGERYDMYAMTAAHKTLPLPTYARVTNVKNGRSAVVKINDRGPFHGSRVIDLSYSAARKLGVVAKGTAMVEVRAIDPRHPDSDRNMGFLASDDSVAKATTPADKKVLVAQETPAPKKPVPPAEEPAARVAKVEKPHLPAKDVKVLVAKTEKPPAPVSDVPVQGAKTAKPSAPEPKAAVAMTEAKTRKAAVSRMYLQVGAFGSRANAESLQHRLSSHIAEQVQVRMIDAAAPWYKVHVGPLESRKEAKDLSQHLASLGVAGSHIVVE